MVVCKAPASPPRPVATTCVATSEREVVDPEDESEEEPAAWAGAAPATADPATAAAWAGAAITTGPKLTPPPPPGTKTMPPGPEWPP